MSKFTPPTIPGLKIKYGEVKEGSDVLLQYYTAYVGEGYRVFDVSRGPTAGKKKNPPWRGSIRVPVDEDSAYSENVFSVSELRADLFYALADAAAKVTLPLFVKYGNVTKAQAQAVASVVKPGKMRKR